MASHPRPGGPAPSSPGGPAHRLGEVCRLLRGDSPAARGLGTRAVRLRCRGAQRRRCCGRRMGTAHSAARQAARPRIRTDGHHLPAAGPHARPGLSRPPRGHQCRHHKLRQRRAVAGDRGPGSRRRRRRPTGVPRTAQQPGLPGRSPPPPGRQRRPGGHRRSALHIGLGP